MKHLFPDCVQAKVEKLTNHPPGHPQYLGPLRKVVSIVINGLCEEELVKVDKLREDWHLKGPSPEVQARQVVGIVKT